MAAQLTAPEVFELRDDDLLYCCRQNRPSRFGNGLRPRLGPEQAITVEC